MENTTDALKMAFAILVFMIGISILFSLVGTLKQTADEVLYYSDNTNFYVWESGTGKSSRIVQEKEIIANLYSDSPNVNIIIYKDGKQIFSSSDPEGSITTIINKELSNGDTYIEQIAEINSADQYVTADDGTRIRTRLGETKLQIIYIKQ